MHVICMYKYVMIHDCEYNTIMKQSLETDMTFNSIHSHVETLVLADRCERCVISIYHIISFIYIHLILQSLFYWNVYILQTK